MISTHYVQANGMQLAYETFGTVSNPAVLLVHGLATQMLAWPTPLCELLADAGFYVVRFDNRDIGLSTSLETWGQPRCAIRLAEKLIRCLIGVRLTRFNRT